MGFCARRSRQTYAPIILSVVTVTGSLFFYPMQLDAAECGAIVGCGDTIPGDTACPQGWNASSSGCGPACGNSCLPDQYDDPCYDTCYGTVSDLPYWIRGSYLAWQIDGFQLPPLITSSPAGTPIGSAARLGDPSTTILAGNNIVGDDLRSGYLVEAGLWLDGCRCVAIQGDFFDLGSDDYAYAIGPNSGDIVGRPFFNTQLSTQDMEQVDVPTELAGSAAVRAESEFYSTGVSLGTIIWQAKRGCDCQRRGRLQLFSGYRHYHYEGRLSVVENLEVLPGTTSPLVPGTTIDVTDDFAAKNDFHGGELGLNLQLQRNEWWVDGLAAFAVGANQREIFISGTTVNTVPTFAPSTASGGLLTSSATNIGTYQVDDVVVIPRFRLGVGCQLTHHVSAQIGYNAIVWKAVSHVSDALPANLAVDPRNLPPVQAGGGQDPAFGGFRDETLVAHGLDVGLRVDF